MKPCPFCKSTNTHVTDSNHGAKYFGHCRNCSARGPVVPRIWRDEYSNEDSAREAAVLWDRGSNRQPKEKEHCGPCKVYARDPRFLDFTNMSREQIEQHTKLQIQSKTNPIIFGCSHCKQEYSYDGEHITKIITSEPRTAEPKRNQA